MLALASGEDTALLLPLLGIPLDPDDLLLLATPPQLIETMEGPLEQEDDPILLAEEP